MEKQIPTKELIIEIMQKSESSRNSDFTLYAEYIKYYYPKMDKSQYYDVLQHNQKYKLHSFKGIERLRRKIQEEARKNNDISLLSNKQIAKRRKELEQEYREEYKPKKTRY